MEDEEKCRHPVINRNYVDGFLVTWCENCNEIIKDKENKE